MLRGDNRYVERGRVKGVEWMRSRSHSARGLVVAPPLIGGHALQQLRLLRPLVRRGLDLLSFNYSGHGGSEGTFSLQATVENSSVALDLALEKSQRDRLPLFGIASCYAAVPMLHAVGQGGEPMAKMVLINALPKLRWEKMAADFYRYWRKSPHRQFTLKGLKASLCTYRDELLPNVSHNRQAFGILSRHRIQWLRLIRDLFSFRHLDTAPLSSTPVLCVYGKRDRLLQQLSSADWDLYEALIESVCPHARFRRIDGDHFLKGESTRQQLIKEVVRFFSVP